MSVCAHARFDTRCDATERCTMALHRREGSVVGHIRSWGKVKISTEAGG